MNTAAIDRITRISIERPLLPETYIPWRNRPGEDERFLPGNFVSISDLPICNMLSQEQIKEIERHEAVQFMFSYAWSEALAVKFLGREVAKLRAGASETKFMYREIIEETRHQEMFRRGIEVVDGEPILPTGQHFFWSKIACQYLPSSLMFMVMIAGELVADEIGREVQKDGKVFSVFRKIAELHQIEEGRHIYFAKKYLEDYTNNAGLMKRSLYSIVMAFHIYFMMTMYVKEEIFRRVGIVNSEEVYRSARKNYRKRFSTRCLGSAVAFVRGFNGFNAVTKWFWKWLLNAQIK